MASPADIVRVALLRDGGARSQERDPWVSKSPPPPEVPMLPKQSPARAGKDFSSTTGWHSDPLQEALDHYERALKSSPLAIKHRRL